MSKLHELTSIIYDKKGKVLAIGKNSYVKTHVKMAEHAKKVGEPYRIWLHSEVSAIVKLKGKDIDRAYRIAIFRYNADGTPALAKPCAVCASAIAATNIKVIEYTTNE